MKLILGAGATVFDGWTATQIDELNLLHPEDFQSVLGAEKAEAMLAEHLWEHLSFEEGIRAARNCYAYLQPGGWLRAAVPDGSFRHSAFQSMIQISGPGPADHPAASHKIVYDYRRFRAVFTAAGFKTELLEYCDENGDFHYRHWNDDDGHIGRSFRYDTRNSMAGLGMVSIIIDAHKPLVLRLDDTGKRITEENSNAL